MQVLQKKCITCVSESCILSKMLAILTLLGVTKKAIVYSYTFKMILTFNTRNINNFIIIIDQFVLEAPKEKLLLCLFVCLEFFVYLRIFH